MSRGMQNETILEIEYTEEANNYLLNIYLKYVNPNSPHRQIYCSENSTDRKINEISLWPLKAVVRSGVAIPRLH
jgi:hypothetical protein